MNKVFPEDKPTTLRLSGQYGQGPSRVAHAYMALELWGLGARTSPESGMAVLICSDPRTHPAPAYLRGHPVLPAGGLGLDQALGPGSDVACTVVGIALEDQLAGALLTGKEGTEHHAICHAVQDLKPREEKLQEGHSLARADKRSRREEEGSS